MFEFFTRYFTYRYVGRCEIELTETLTNGMTKEKTKRTGVVFVNFFMTPSGRRRLITTGEKAMVKWTEEKGSEYFECKSWEQGGPFPKTFKPETDTLGEMLTRLVTARLNNAD